MLPSDLLAAYQNTDFNILVRPAIKARPGEVSERVDALFEMFGVTAAAIVTAWNPYSAETTLVENERAQSELLNTTKDLGFASLPAEGVGHEGSWPAEPSLCLLGVTQSTALVLADHFKQNAFVWLQHGKPAEIVLTPIATGQEVSESDLLFVLESRERSGPTSVWKEYLCLSRIGDEMEVSIRRYEALAQITQEYDDDGNEIDRKHPTEINGMIVVGQEDDHLVGGDLRYWNSDEALVFDPYDLPAAIDWLAEQKWLTAARAVAAAIRIL